MTNAPRSEPQGMQAPRTDAERGLYQKYNVERLNDPTGKHKDCDYFILDLVHDKFAWPALVAYASSCKQDFPALTKDLWHLIGTRAPTGKDRARNPVVELEHELSEAQAKLAEIEKRRKADLIIARMLVRDWQRYSSPLNAFDAAFPDVFEEKDNG